MSENMQLTPSCPLCGGAELTIPANPAPNSPVECAACGALLGRYDQFSAKVRAAAAQALEDIDTLIARAAKDDDGAGKG